MPPGPFREARLLTRYRNHRINPILPFPDCPDFQPFRRQLSPRRNPALLPEFDSLQWIRDSFVVEMRVHYPTDLSLLWDAMRCLRRVLLRVCEQSGVGGCSSGCARRASGGAGRGSSGSGCICG